MWDAGQYLKYSEERSRPFYDLLGRVRKDNADFIADLGCGPGNLTQTLAERWPMARVMGVDNSPDMLQRATPLAITGRLEFVLEDISSWNPTQPVDLIVSNAALQWVEGHEQLLTRLASMLAPDGTLAVQLPYHFENPAHLGNNSRTSRIAPRIAAKADAPLYSSVSPECRQATETCRHAVHRIPLCDLASVAWLVTSDAHFIYELPFEPGAQFFLCQGYGGTYSHTGDSHYSLDFRMPEGTMICAARSGVIYRVVDHFDEGGTHPSFKPKANVINVLHVDDTIASYVHLMKNGTLVGTGQFVKIGQPIGLSGNTGWSSCPHLHFHVADAILHKRIPTRFNVGKHEPVMVEAKHWYKRPVSNRSESSNMAMPRRTSACRNESRDRDAFGFCRELLNCKNDLIGHLSEAGYDLMVDYSSVDVLHDVHGLEVCGIHNPDEALDIIRLLLRLFPGWNAGWLHPPGSSSQQKWVASIQRDRDPVMEY